MNSFLAQGGDGFTGFLQGRDPRSAPSDLHALVRYLQNAPAADLRHRIRLR
ncbi:MAG: hypothetical protein ACK5QW_04860 [Cyanobacteriota bacterium]